MEPAFSSLPSPAASSDGPLTEDTPSTSSLPISTNVDVRPSTKRKRALSDADDRVTKHPSNMPPVQRNQCVSDPLSSSIYPILQSAQHPEDYFAEVFHNNYPLLFDIPAPVQEIAWDESAVFDIDIHTYRSSGIASERLKFDNHCTSNWRNYSIYIS